MGRLSLTLCLLALVLVSSACQEDILLKKSTRYTYEAEVLGKTSVDGGSNQDAQLEVKCTLKVQHNTKCTYTLDFEKCSVKASRGNQNDRKTWLDDSNWTQFSEHPITFIVQDGEVRSVYAHADDPLYVVNMKKGFISSIILGNQPAPTSSETTRKDYRDVQGLCPMKVSFRGHTISTVKDLDNCVLPKKPQVQLSPFSIYWDSGIQKPLIRSSLQCESVLEDGQIIRRINCLETHASRVDSSHNTEFGRKTTIQYQLVLKESGAESENEPELDQLRLSGIEYEHEDPNTFETDDPSHARELLATLVDQTEVDLETIPTFLALVQQMRYLNDLSQLTQDIENCPGGDKQCARKSKGIPLYLEALAHCNRLPCVKALRELHSKKLVSKSFLEFALFSWLRMPLSDHRYFNEFLEMCRSSQTRFCWLGLGGLVRTYSQNHEEIPDGLRQTVELVSTTLGQSCGLNEVSFPSQTSTVQKTNYIMTMLKSLGNMGKVILDVEPGLDNKILNCAKNTDLQIPPRIVALQTLEQVDHHISTTILDEVSSILFNESLPVDLRTEAYHLLIKTQKNNQDFAIKLASLLKTDVSKQIKSYISSDIIEWRRKGDDAFWTAFDDEISKNGVDIYSLAAMDAHTTSHVTYHESSSFLPDGILPDDMNGFGHSLLTSTVFGGWSAIPQSITTKLNLTLLGQAMEFMEVGLQMSGLDGLFIRSRSSLSGMQTAGNTNLMQYIALILQQLSPPRKASTGRKTSAPPVLLNQQWEENLERIYQSYQKSHAQETVPHIMLYLRMLGLDLDYTTFPDIVGAIQRFLQDMNQRQRPTKGHSDQQPFSETHLLNFLEAEYLLPTLMGTLVKWENNFTLAVSLDASLNVNMKEKSGDLHLKPRLTSTLLSKMVFGIPGLTEMGIDCKNTLFTGTEYNFQASTEADQSIRLAVLPPKTKQRPLELYRNNYLVSNNEVIELDDWDAERINHVHCLGDKFVKATGMHVCMNASYLDVKHREDKPFYLLSGRASWLLSAEMEDKGVDAYALNIHFDDKSKGQIVLDITGDARGSVWTRDIPLKITYDKNDGEFLLSLKHSDFPEFNFAIERVKLSEAEQHTGYRSSILIEDEGKRWDIIYSKSKKKETRQDKSISRNESPREKSVEAHVDERIVTLKSPFNEYNYKLKLHKQSSTGNLKVDSRLSYENLNENYNWLNRILPQIFWDKGNRKAWLEFRGDWRSGHSSKSHKHGQHETKSQLSIPATVIEVNSRHIHKPKHTMHGFNVSKIERSTGKLLLFANMTYNVWRKGKEGEPINEIRTANLTLARHSWNLDAHRNGNLFVGREGEETATYVLKGEKMIPKDPTVDGNYIGWWSPESASRFDPEKWQVTYQHNLKRVPVEDSDLPTDSKNEIQDDLSSEEDDGHSSEEDLLTLSGPGVRNEAVHADASLTYPFEGNQENLTFKGTFQRNGKVSPPYRIFLETFTLGSTLHKLEIESRSLWTKAGNEKVIASVQSSFKDINTKRDHGVYNLLFRKQLQPDKCTNVLLNHSFTGHWYNFASHVIGNCKPGNPKARLYDIQIHAVHPYWKELDFDLFQKFDLDLPGGESMNLTSPTMDIKVTGDWSVNRYHKKAEFISKTDLMPSTTWELDSNKETGVIDFSINAPEEDLQGLKIHRTLNKNKDRAELLVEHKEKSKPDFEEDAHFMAKVINSHSILLNGSLKPELGLHMLQWLANFVHHSIHRFISKLADPNHEFNENLKDHMEGKTIWQYLMSIQTKLSQKAYVVMKDISEIIRTFESFYGPSFQIVSNTVAEINKARRQIAQALSDTVLGWTWDYFEIGNLLSATLAVNNDWKFQENNFTEIINHPFIWNKFNELPTLDRGLIRDAFQCTFEKESSFALPTRQKQEKVAMIFGPSHVLTFDGHHYLFPEYPNEACTVLLAQDVRGKSFSILINKENLYLVFPNLAVTVHGSGRIYINTSSTETSTPVYSNNRDVKVIRFGDIIRVESQYLRVDCDTNNEFCILLLNPMLSGGIIGLLGNADGERHNEFTNPRKEVIDKASDLAAIYEVSGQPNCKTFSESAPVPVEDAQATRRCNRLFKQDPVSQCLNSAGLTEADIRPACVSDFFREGCPCSTSKALSALCAYEGYSLDRCQFQRRPEGSTPVPNQHESWLVKGTSYLQLAIIVENHQSLFRKGSTQAIKGLETLLENVEEAFTSDGGYSSVDYALIVFGGDEEPHLHTQHRSAWMSQRDFLKSVRDVGFQSSERGNPIAAVEFASSMIVYDPSATKIVLLITVDDILQYSHGSEHVHSVQQHLEENGAALYVLSSYPGLERGKKVFGLRADGLIFPNEGADAYGEFPRSPCAKLAAGTRGSIFWRSFLEENKNPFFFESMSSEMLARVSKETGKCRQCTCSMSPWWQMHTHCKPAQSHLQHC